MAGKEPRITVHGVTGGQVENSNVAGINYGGMGSKNSDRSFRNYGNMGHAVTGNPSGSVSGNVGAGQAGDIRKNSRNLSSTELLDHVRRCECSEETINIFAEQRVTGSVFMDLDDDLLNDLNITNKLDIRKLKSLKNELSSG